MALDISSSFGRIGSRMSRTAMDSLLRINTSGSIAGPRDGLAAVFSGDGFVVLGFSMETESADLSGAVSPAGRGVCAALSDEFVSLDSLTDLGSAPRSWHPTTTRMQADSAARRAS